jgi:hypothetical protein
VVWHNTARAVVAAPSPSAPPAPSWGAPQLEPKASSQVGHQRRQPARAYPEVEDDEEDEPNYMQALFG